MNIEKEIRITKLQIMWTIALSTIVLYSEIQTPVGYPLSLLLIPLYIGLWYVGAISIRKGVEEEGENEE